VVTTPNVTAKQVLANPKAYSHKIIKVRGCLYLGFERVVLRPCEGGSEAEEMWLENAAIHMQIEGFMQPADSEKPSVIFEYDQNRNLRAWRKLQSLSETNLKAPEIMIVGQFETAASDQESSKLGFGHLGAYKHELIVQDVLSDVSPNGSQGKT
jgi:hypothetical protein